MFKSLARELSVPVRVLSQLNRELERGGTASHGFAAEGIRLIEQHAHVVGLLHRDAVPVNLWIAEQRKS